LFYCFVPDVWSNPFRCSPKTATEPLTDVSEPAEAEQEPVTIKWWVPNWDEEVAKVLVSEFEAENPNIKVK
jgi:ABC-type glycerol-3-phosphate transport system substrate-binding protein